MEKLAWAELSEEEFLARLAPEAWKAPVLHIRSDGRYRIGRPGISKAKAKGYIYCYGTHFSSARKLELSQLLFKRAADLYNDRCCVWAEAALRANSRFGIWQADWGIREKVPEGARGDVRKVIDSAIDSQLGRVFEMLKSRKIRAVE